MRGNKLIVRPANLLVELDVRSSSKTALSGNGRMKNAADEQRVITNVRPKQKRLLGIWPGKRDEHVGNVLFREMVGLVGDLQPARARKCFKQRRDIIAQFAVTDPALLQDVPGQNVKIKLGRYPQVPA